MRGLELSQLFYFKIVKKLINEHFPVLINKYSAGLIGYGSDVLGNDDDMSKDHEWGPRCHIWLEDEDYAMYAAAMDKMLQENLPLEYLGYKTRFIFDEEFGALVTTDDKAASFHHVAITTVKRHLKIQFGIECKDVTTNEYYLDNVDWLCIPEQKLLELTRGRIFEDTSGEISKVRKKFSYYNEEVWKYKLMYCWGELSDFQLIPLCYKRGEKISASILLNKVIENVVRLVYLYNRTYYPGYMKWFSYEFRRLPKLGQSISYKLEECLVEQDVTKIIEILEAVFGELLEEHNKLGITDHVEFEPSKSSRGLVNISLWNVYSALESKISDELKNLSVRGSCDQWITNGDMLIWSEQFTKLKDIYLNNKVHKRNGIGYRIV